MSSENKLIYSHDNYGNSENQQFFVTIEENKIVDNENFPKSQFFDKTTLDILNDLCKRGKFKKYGINSRLIYQNSFFSIPIPVNVNPIISFPQILIHKDYIKNEHEVSDFLSIVEKSFDSFKNIRITFHHTFGFCKDLILQIPFSPVSKSTNIFEAISETLGERNWKDPILNLCKLINVDLENLILQAKFNQKIELISPFDTIINTFRLLFSEEGIFQPISGAESNITFIYDVVSLPSFIKNNLMNKFSQENHSLNQIVLPKLNTDLNQALKHTPILDFLHTILTILIPVFSQWNGSFDEEIKEILDCAMTKYLLSFISKHDKLFELMPISNVKWESLYENIKGKIHQIEKSIDLVVALTYAKMDNLIDELIGYIKLSLEFHQLFSNNYNSHDPPSNNLHQNDSPQNDILQNDLPQKNILKNTLSSTTLRSNTLGPKILRTNTLNNNNDLISSNSEKKCVIVNENILNDNSVNENNYNEDNANANNSNSYDLFLKDFGSVIFSCPVTNLLGDQFHLILTKGILRIFTVKSKIKAEIFLPFFNDSQSLDELLFEIPIQSTYCMKIPTSNVCLLKTPKDQIFLVFNNDDTNSATTNNDLCKIFWILLNFCQCIMNKKSFSPPHPKTWISLWFFKCSPNSESVYANIVVDNNRWQAQFSLEKYVYKLGKIGITNTETLLSGGNYEICGKLNQKIMNFDHLYDSIYGLKYSYSDLISYVTKEKPIEFNKYDLIYSLSYDLATCHQIECRFKILKILGIANFSFALKNQLFSLLQYQINEFYLPYFNNKQIALKYKFRQLPILNLSTMLSDGEEILCYLIKNLNWDEVKSSTNKAITYFSLHNSSCSNLQTLHQNEINVNQPKKIGISPIMSSVQNNYSDKISFLCKKGIYIRDSLIWAIENNKLNIANELITFCSQEFNYPDKKGRFLIHILINKYPHGLYQLSKYWEIIDPNRYIPNSEYPHPIFYILQQKEPLKGVLHALLSFPNINLNIIDENGETPLTYAISNNVSSPLVQILLKDKRCNVDQLNEKGKSPLFIAVENSNFNFVKFLIERKVIVNYPNDNLMTPLKQAKLQGNNEIIELLQKNGANDSFWDYDSEDDDK